MKNLGIEHGEMFYFTLDENGKIEHSKYDFTKTTTDELQQMINKLIRLKMITLVKNKQTIVSVCVWVIDETDTYYIETFHEIEDNNFTSDDDRTMKFEEFFDSIV